MTAINRQLFIPLQIPGKVPLEIPLFFILRPSLVPIDGGLTPWSTWSTCTETCGTGTRTRTKTCTNPLPQNGGKDCTGLGDTQRQEDCNTQNCPGKVFQESVIEISSPLLRINVYALPTRVREMGPK